METDYAVLVLCNKNSKSADARDGGFVNSCSRLQFGL